ncbi:PREDICTED: probable ATP-dependent RNA helicase DDX31 [Dufourea novaeangliae]|uniref:probable ATP-dependent RNA helicase DDX31 n=1 Tax=Dufourea novaeangliae TaxID=178035 RepID=UPI000766E824|nr:PREDICTED: probable ATP-dependent RNA helicase DDX31 [Dufourea novaeangliae]
MTVQDMDISLNISAEPAAHKKTGNTDDSILSLMKQQKNKTGKSKVVTNDKSKLESANFGPKKRVKQKFLSRIVAKRLKGASSIRQPLKKSTVQKKVKFKIEHDDVTHKNSKREVDKSHSTVGSKDIDVNESLSTVHTEATTAPVISFTKVTKENFGKTLLARKRPIKDTDSKKTLSSIFLKQNELASTGANLLSLHKKIDTDEDVVSRKKSKLEETGEFSSLNETADNTSKMKKKFTEPKKSSSPMEKTDQKKKKHVRKSIEKSHSNLKNEKGTHISHKSTGKVSSLFGHNPEIPNIGQRLVKPINEQVFAGTTFTDLNVHPFTISNLEQNMKITKMTIVQQKAIPQVLSGKDVLIRSQTGSGKTLAYALPIVEFLHKIRPKLNRNSGLKALVVVPTRELALQTYECFLKLIKPFTWIVPGYLAGGEKRKAEKARLRKGCNILVGTPGRLLDHIKMTAALKLGDVKYFVLDEADRMFDMGYEKDISGIVSALKVSTPGENTSYDAMKMLRQNVKKVFTEEELEHIEDGTDSKNETQTEDQKDLESDSEDKVNKQRPVYHSSSDNDSEKDEEEPFVKSKKSDKRKISSSSSKTEDPKVSNSSAQQKEIEVDSNNPSRRQTILLSATLTQAVETLAGLAMEHPVFVDAAKENLEMTGNDLSDLNEDLVVPQSVVQTYIVTPPKLRMVTLSAYIAGKCQSHGQHKILIFMATQDMVDYHTEILSTVLSKPVDDEDEDSDPLVDVEFFKLHGNMTQKERTDVFKTFRLTDSGVLLCTDVAARGLDLPKVDSVVQYTGPTSARDYVHRIGRTARAGSSGSATIFLTPPEIEFVRMLESRRIRIKQESMEDVLDKLLTPLCKHTSAQGAAIALQNEFENLLLEESKLRGKAVKAYISWIRFYSSYPRDMREIFNRKDLHLGHFAKSFALRETPQRIGGLGKKLREKDTVKPQHNNKLSNERPDGVLPAKKSTHDQPRTTTTSTGLLKRVRMLNTSEYGSGLEPARKPKKS